MLVMLRRGSQKWHGIWRPPDAGSASAATACRKCSYGVWPSARESDRSR